MTRTLPWKRREQDVSSHRGDSRRRSTADPRIKREDVGSSLDESELAPSPGPSKRLRRLSSPTNVSKGPPQERFMIEGLDGDDRFRMVEDEFLSTAHQFTAHLHAAEYERLKAAAQTENAQTIKNISRPVVGHMTDLVRIKRERKALEEKQRLAVRKLRKQQRHEDEEDDDESGLDDEDPSSSSWQKQSLYGLMESPTRSKRYTAAATATSTTITNLDGIIPAATSVVTRAAAGYNSKVVNNKKAVVVISPRRPELKELELESSIINPTGVAHGHRDTHTHTHKNKDKDKNENQGDSSSSVSGYHHHGLTHRSSRSEHITTPSSRIAAATATTVHKPSGIPSSNSHRRHQDHHQELPQPDQRPDMALKKLEAPGNKSGQGEERGKEHDEGEEELDFIARMKKRQEERKRSREQRRSTIGSNSRNSSTSRVRSTSADILPDFL